MGMRILAAGALALVASVALGAETDVDALTQPRAQRTQHELTLDGKVIKYTATVGWLVLKRREFGKQPESEKGEPDPGEKPIARFGYTAYTLDGVKDASRRPVTFAFNGGPGSSSIWLHMAVLGPKRVVVNDGGYAPPPPVQLADNQFTILDATDIVMIDPVGTGFSKPLGDAKGSEFWGVDPDIESVAAFISRYVTENGRWGSPKYVLGESYGGIRGSGLANYLQSRLGMNLNGLILVSPYFTLEAGSDGIGIDLPHAMYLPTFAATAAYYDALAEKPASLDAFLAEVERFAYDEYIPALLKGSRLPDADRQAMAAKLARYTGTTAEFWQKADLRVSHPQFLQELLRSRGLIAGRIDARFPGPSLNPLNDAMDYDPFIPSVLPAFIAGFRSYLRADLAFDAPDEYAAYGNLFKIWDWSHAQPGIDPEEYPKVPSPNVLPDLALALTMNPGLHLLIEQGIYDHATPTLALKYNLDHLKLTPEARSRIRVNYHAAGHMMYLNLPIAAQFRSNLVGFIRETDRL